MAIPAQGCEFTWDNETLEEIREFEVNPSQERFEFAGDRGSGASSFYYVGGDLRLIGYSVAGLEQHKIGKWAEIKITVRVSPTQVQTLWEGWAQYLSSSVRASINGPVSFAFQFRLWGAFQSIGNTGLG